MARMPAIAIVMATRDGAAFLAPQLESVAAQGWRDWSLWVGDDGSTDGTRAILADFAARHPGHQVRLGSGPGRGAAANFLSVLLRDDLPPGPVAFCDQDDVWLPRKLEQAMAHLRAVPPGTPALYGCRVIHMDAQGVAGGLSPLWRRGPSFANALVQNIVGGHAAVLNAEGAALLRAASRGVAVPFHDWWAYQVIAGAGGTVIADREPGLYYRQHAGNLMGSRGRIGAKLRRISALGRGEFAGWFDANLLALEQARDLLMPEARALAAEFAAIRRMRGVAAARRLRASGIHRQSATETALLRLAAARGAL